MTLAFEVVPDTWEVTAATTPAKKPKERKPEEVWYDVHKHPEGVPGGMGKSPEHHLRNRGWSSHEIHGATDKTIQYHNQKYPDFVISYGGGSGTKPDHNFGITYLGTNTNIPKKHRAYSVAEAMNRVEELHKLQVGHIVLPMTHDSAVQPQLDPSDIPDVPQTPPAPHRDMDVADAFPDFPSQPVHTEHFRNPNRNYQLHQIPAPPPIKPPKATKAAAGPERMQNDHGTLSGGNRHKAAGEPACALCSKAARVYRKDPGLYRDLLQDSGGLTDEHLRVTSQFHDRVQQATVLGQGKPPRHPQGQGPTDLGRPEYQRQYRQKQRAKDDADVAGLARQYGMDIEPDEVSKYRGLRGVVSALRAAQQDSWEES